jgi:DNA mismatch repair protein MutL
MPIKILDQEVVSQIAAGEVVERPASVVKELVENALDAGSTQISVEIRGGGIGLIRVTDNGSGIPTQEVELAFHRYATSKVSSVDDLTSIASLGFRGEALPSIAAVAYVDMLTCAAGESVGDYVSLRDSSIVSHKRQGRSQGTTVSVRNLFRRVPARLKFLKAPATENSHIAQVVTEYALAFPDVKFSLVIDGRAVLRSPGSSRLLDVVVEVYGLEVAQNMVEIESKGDDWNSRKDDTSPAITGMISTPNISRSTRDYLSFFVNRRWISSRLLSWVVEEAYHGLLMQGRHPIAIINIALPPGEVDVNIHPAKAEVKFQNNRGVSGAVQKAVRNTLISLAPVPRIEEVATTYSAPPRPSQELQELMEKDAAPATPPPVIQPTPLISLPALRILGQISSSYIVTEGPDGLYLIDQHAAHERILYEKLRDQWAQKRVEVQGLLEPVSFEVNPAQDEVLKLNYQELGEFGFSLEPFGDRTYLVRAVPALLHNRDWAAMVRELLDEPPGEDRNDWTDKIAVSLACHSAIRAGKVLTDDEMRELVQQLEQTHMPRTCPHGRPTMIHLSSQQLEKEFRRR